MNRIQSEASAKNRNERNKKIANSYEWFSDEVDYFRCSEMINVFVEMHFHIFYLFPVLCCITFHVLKITGVFPWFSVRISERRSMKNTAKDLIFC